MLLFEMSKARLAHEHVIAGCEHDIRHVLHANRALRAFTAIFLLVLLLSAVDFLNLFTRWIGLKALFETAKPTTEATICQANGDTGTKHQDA